MGRWCTIIGVLVSIGTAYLVMQFLSIMDYVQALFSFFIAPLFGTVFLACCGSGPRRRVGSGAAAGTLSSIAMWAWVKLVPSALVDHRAFSQRQGYGREYVPRALVVADLRGRHGGRQPTTKPLPEKQLVGLVYGCTEIPSEGATPLFQRPVFWAAIVAVVFVVLNILFW